MQIIIINNNNSNYALQELRSLVVKTRMVLILSVVILINYTSNLFHPNFTGMSTSIPRKEIPWTMFAQTFLAATKPSQTHILVIQIRSINLGLLARLWAALSTLGKLSSTSKTSHPAWTLTILHSEPTDLQTTIRLGGAHVGKTCLHQWSWGRADEWF